MREEKKIAIMISIVVVGIIAIIFMGQNIKSDQINSDNTGYAAHPVYSSFEQPINAFSIDKTAVLFSSSDTTQSLTITTNDTAVYNTAYVSINSGAWQQVIMTGTTLGSNWITGQATANINIPKTNIAEGTSNENYIIIYSCTRNSSGWNCHDYKWQLMIFNTTKNTISQIAGTLLANGFENNGSLKNPFIGTSAGSIAADKEYAHTGQYSLKQTAGATLSYTSPDCCTISSVIANVSGNQTEINLTAYVISQSQGTVGMSIMCLDDAYTYWDGNGSVFYLTTSATSMTSWTKIALNGICDSRATHIAVRLENQGNNGTNIWWDDVTLLTTPISQQISNTTNTTTNNTMSCTGLSTQSCAITNGQGTQTRTCNNTTGTWGAPLGICTIQSCNSGYFTNGTVCSNANCTGSSTQICAITNGIGSQTRTCINATWGAPLGTCNVVSCNNGYTQSGNACVASQQNTSSNNSFESLTYPKPPKTLIQGQVCSSDGKITVRADANKPTYLASRMNTGIAMFRLSWSDSVNPFSTTGQYIAPSFIEGLIRNLSTPLIRDYHLDGEPGGVNGALDMMATYTAKEGIPQDKVILELERAYEGSGSRMMTPAQWAAAVQYSMSKGYKFKIWEVSNEPQYAWSTPYCYVENYSQHVNEVYNAIKAVQPDAIVGAEVNRVSWYSDTLLSGAKGHYDFIAGHFYAFANSTDQSFENVVLTENYRTLSYIAQTNAKISTNNPTNNNIYQMDTEWRLMINDGETDIRHGNMWGVTHAGVRMIYNIRDGYMRGSTYWSIRGGQPQNIIPSGYDSSSTFLDGKYSYNYWLFYYMTHNTGDVVLNSSTTSTPCLTGSVGGNVDTGSSTRETYTGPQAPVMVTINNDSSAIYVTIANGNWTSSMPLEINIANYNIHNVSATTIVGDGNLAGAWLCTSKATCTSSLALTYNQDTGLITGTMPAHSVAFITIQ